GERLVNLVVEVVTIGHQQEREVPGHLSSHLLGEERHRIGFAAALSMPEYTKPPEIGMSPLDDIHRAFGDEGRLRRFSELSVQDSRTRRLVFARSPLKGQLNHAMLEPALGWKFALQLLLPHRRGHRTVDTEDLVIARHHLSRGPGFALVEEDEVFDDVE